MKFKCHICNIIIDVKSQLIDPNTGEIRNDEVIDREIDLAHFFGSHPAVSRNALKKLGVWEEIE